MCQNDEGSESGTMPASSEWRQEKYVRPWRSCSQTLDQQLQPIDTIAVSNIMALAMAWVENEAGHLWQSFGNRVSASVQADDSTRSGERMNPVLNEAGYGAYR